MTVIVQVQQEVQLAMLQEFITVRIQAFPMQK